MESDTFELDRDPVELLADEFLRLRRLGGRPTVQDFARRHPQWSHQILEVFPALLALETVSFEVAATDEVARDRVDSNGAGGDLRPGERLGDYEIVRELGRGAMGIVYEAVQEALGRRVALKVLARSPSAEGGEEGAERFRREARAAARLHHTNIVPVFDVGQVGGTCYYAMQFIVGQPLDDVLRALRSMRRGGSADDAVRAHESSDRGQLDGSAETIHGVEATVVSRITGARPGDKPVANPPASAGYQRSVALIGQQVAEALQHAHERGVVHRDIKPGNLLLDQAGVVWVADFGLAKTEEPVLTRHGDVLGTLRYMAPERFRGESGAAADIYALGATLYELLTLRPAHDVADGAELVHRICHGEPVPPRTIEAAIPRDLERIVLKALEREPRRRYASAAELAEDLRRYLHDEPLLGRPPGLVEQLARWARQHRALAASVAVTSLLLLVVAVASGIIGDNFRRLAAQEREARFDTARSYYHALLREAEATRLARREGYRTRVWDLLAETKKLDLPELNQDALRLEASQTLGDFVGAAPLELAGFAAGVASVAIGRGTVAVGLADGTVAWFDRATGESQGERRLHAAPVRLLHFHAESEECVSVDEEGLAIIWRRERADWLGGVPIHLEGVPLAIGTGPFGEPRVALRPRPWTGDPSPPGLFVQSLTIGGGDSHREASTSATPIDCHELVTAAALSWRGDLLAGIVGDKVAVWDVRSGRELQRASPPLGPPLALAFSRDGARLWCGGDEGVVVLDLPDLRPVQSMRRDQSPHGAFAASSPTLAFACVNRQVTLWNVTANRELATLAHPGETPLRALVFSEPGDALATADERSVRVWRLTQDQEQTQLVGHEGGVVALATAGDRRLCSIGKDRRMLLWDAAGSLASAVALPGRPCGLSVDSKSGQVAVATRDGTLRICDHGRLLNSLDVSHDLGDLTGVRFADEGTRLLAAGSRGVMSWRLTRRGGAAGVVDSAEPVGPDSGRLAVDVAPERQFTASLAEALAVSERGAWLAWVDAGRKIHVADRTNGVEWPCSAPAVIAWDAQLDFHPDGRRLAFVDRHGGIVMWDVVLDRLVHEIPAEAPGRGRPGGTLALSPAGDKVAARDDTLRVGVWDVETGRQLLRFREGAAVVSSLAWSDSGDDLAIGGQDGGLVTLHLQEWYGALEQLGLSPENVRLPPLPPEEDVAAAATQRTPLELLSEAVDDDSLAGVEADRLRVRRAEVMRRLGAVEPALADVAQVVGRNPGDTAARRLRAELLATLGRWGEAATEREQADEARGDGDGWQAAATTALWYAMAEHREGASRSAARAASRLDDRSTPLDRQHALRIGMLLPGQAARDSAPWSELIRRVERDVERPGTPPKVADECRLSLALAALRTGEPRAAVGLVEQCQRSSLWSEDPRRQALSFYLLALSQFEVGQSELARLSREAGDSLPWKSDPAARLTVPPDQTALVLAILSREASRCLPP